MYTFVSFDCGIILVFEIIKTNYVLEERYVFDRHDLNLCYISSKQSMYWKNGMLLIDMT